MIKIIPAIDIIEGRCVRLEQGEYSSKKIYNENPVEVAMAFEGAGLKRLHIVDLDGARADRVVNISVLEQIAAKTSLVIDFGGGIKSEADLKKVLAAGAAFVTIGSIAAKEPPVFKRWLDTYGSERIILGADVKNNNIAVSGWTDVTGLGIFDFIGDNIKAGIKYVLCTDISKDGMLAGTSVDLYLELKARFPGLKIIASGGITGIDEIRELDSLGLYGVIIGKAIYEGKIKLKDLNKYYAGKENNTVS
jgi:phosphoribosylformimino-5-aminoimidazole carboxamide ribotide isomerase